MRQVSGHTDSVMAVKPAPPTTVSSAVNQLGMELGRGFSDRLRRDSSRKQRTRGELRPITGNG
jgi:hypothetical protein